jgi:hypothetical protein
LREHHRFYFQYPQTETIVGESNSSTICHINLGVKHISKRSAGKPHVAFDEAGTGNVAGSRYCDTRKRKGELTGNTKVDLNQRASPRPDDGDKEIYR